MVRRPVACIVAVVLFAEAFGAVALNWFLGVVVDRQEMSLAGLDPDVMSVSSKAAGVAFGAFLALCGLVALLVAVRGRRPAGLGRALLIGAAVVHGLLGAVAWGLVGPGAFAVMILILALLVLLLMTHDGQGPRGTRESPGDREPDGTQGPHESPEPPRRAQEPVAAPGEGGAAVSPPPGPTSP
ncbi:hypothetical protein [Streptomyces sp. AD55]|uniref:hypothetical protein n=1 Tax=Streptomyces sp. AD55 TaxID=3242895 RepID=UPI0035296521